MKKHSVKLLKTRFPVFALIVSLLLSLILTTAGTAFAASNGDISSSATTAGLEVTGFSVSPATGNITRGTPVTITLNVFDDRIVTGTTYTNIQAVGTVNTSSFTGSSQPAAINAGTNGSTYTLTFNLTYTGTGNTFSCYISYVSNGVSLPLPITSITPITISNTVEYVPPPPATPPEPAPTIPTDFILRDASYGSETIYAGEPFTLTVTILATNGSSAVNNVSVSFSPPEQMTFVDGSSVVFVGTMQPGSTATVSANLMPNGNITEGSYIVNIIVEGFNSDGMRLSAPMMVSIPVLQPERFEIFNTMLPTFLTAGMDDGMGFASVTLVNKGQGAVSNVTVDVAGEGLFLSDGRQFIGNINGGAQSNADFMISASTPGHIAALVIVSYENVRGEQKTLEYPFDIDVVEFVPPEIDDPGFIIPEEPAATGLPVWGWLLIAAGAAVAVIILVRRRIKKKAEAEAALDDLDDDDDD